MNNLESISISLIENFENNKLHHGLLLSGIKGIGKAEFAHSLATRILISSSSNTHEDLNKIKAGTHPDLLIIKKEEKKRDIVVDAVREMTDFLSLTSSISKYKVIIIDAIDDLNKNSSNAILKTLEEPPANVFLLLINHNPAKVLDTIKSRCRTIKIPAPNFEDFKKILKENIENISDDEVKILSKISDNSVGTAMAMYSYNAIDLYEQIEYLANNDDQKAVIELAKSVAANEEIWDIFEKLMGFYFYNLAKNSNENKDKVFTTIDKANGLLLASRNLNLDKSQTILNIFNIIKN